MLKRSGFCLTEVPRGYVRWEGGLCDPSPPAAGAWKRVPDVASVALRPIDYARNDKRRGRIGLRRWFSSLVRRCVGSRLTLSRPRYALPSRTASPTSLPASTLTLCRDSLKVK